MTTDQAPLRVCIDARLYPGRHGGVEQGIVGLAHGLAEVVRQDLQAAPGSEQYYFLVYEGEEGWLAPYVDAIASAGAHSQFLYALRPSRPPPTARKGLGRLLNSVRYRARSAACALMPQVARRLGLVTVPTSEGSIERAGIHVMHFALQWAFLTAVPSIYQPWDLQHVHHPRFFTPVERARREATYRAFCEQAQSVVVATEWGKADLVRHYRLPPEKVAVIPLASPLATIRGELSDPEALRSYGLPARFLLFPAQSWQHKNHSRLFEAIAFLRDRENLPVHVVCTGRKNDYYPKLEAYASQLGVQTQVTFPGYVDAKVMSALYRACVGLIFPSRFEGWGFPVIEAMDTDVPVGCSTATALCETVGDAALTFDPDDVPTMAAVIRTLWTDEAARADLIARGKRRAAGLTWARVAESYRELYRHLGQPRL